MADDTHKLQEDPPEGSREVIEKELERQSGSGAAKPGNAGKDSGEPGSDGSRGRAKG
jgi:hypothetical protein